MQVRHIDHIQLAMPGGCDDEAREPLKVHLGVEQDFVPARKAHPALVAEGLRELAAGLQRAGYNVSRDQPLEGYDRLYVDDPFGNRIELMEPKR
jgi:hypothetical protein